MQLGCRRLQVRRAVAGQETVLAYEDGCTGTTGCEAQTASLGRLRQYITSLEVCFEVSMKWSF